MLLICMFLILQNETINVSIDNQGLAEVENIKPKNSILDQFYYVREAYKEVKMFSPNSRFEPGEPEILAKEILSTMKYMKITDDYLEMLINEYQNEKIEEDYFVVEYVVTLRKRAGIFEFTRRLDEAKASYELALELVKGTQMEFLIIPPLLTVSQKLNQWTDADQYVISILQNPYFSTFAHTGDLLKKIDILIECFEISVYLGNPERAVDIYERVFSLCHEQGCYASKVEKYFKSYMISNEKLKRQASISEQTFSAYLETCNRDIKQFYESKGSDFQESFETTKANSNNTIITRLLGN